MSYHPHYCTILYSISCLLDALDGYAARKYNQSTKFGAVLDMVTDRCTTSCLLCFLSSAYPKWAILFQSLISLDLASHYMHMWVSRGWDFYTSGIKRLNDGMNRYASLDRGSGSHKKVEKKRSRILNLYYSNNVRVFSTQVLVWFRIGPLLIPPTEGPFHLLRSQRGLLPGNVPPQFPRVCGSPLMAVGCRNGDLPYLRRETDCQCRTAGQGRRFVGGGWSWGT